MGRSTNRRRAKTRRIGPEAREAFLLALRGGAGIEGAAEAGGFTVSGFQSAKARDSVFRLAWAMARELCAADDADARRLAAAGTSAPEDESGAVRIAPNNGRHLQKRRLNHVRFTERRRGIFLAWFAATADVEHSAGEAGVDESTVYKTRRNDPDFAAAFDSALADAYVRLEAEAARQRIAAQAALKAAPEPPAGQTAEEFGRLMTLLQRWDRRAGKGTVREISRERMKSASFDEAMAVLAKRLKALGYQPAPPPPEQA